MLKNGPGAVVATFGRISVRVVSAASTASAALASIGLTIPAVAVVAILLAQPLELGLGAKDQVLLALTLLVGVITLGTGRTTVLQGIVHLVIFAVFLFFAVVP